MNIMFGRVAADTLEAEMPAAAATPSVPLTKVLRVILLLAILPALLQLSEM
jgi:hypothetical protein